VSEHRTHRTRSQIIIAIPHRCFLLPTISWLCQKSDHRGLLLRQHQPWTLNKIPPNNPLPIPTHQLYPPNASHLTTSNTLLHSLTTSLMVARFPTSNESLLARFDPAATLRDRHDLAMRDGDDDGFVDCRGGRSRFDVRRRCCRGGESGGGEERHGKFGELHVGLVEMWVLVACIGVD
jgi:hypothetical protein